jgi:hypothetical protein
MLEIKKKSLKDLIIVGGMVIALIGSKQFVRGERLCHYTNTNVWIVEAGTKEWPAWMTIRPSAFPAKALCSVWMKMFFNLISRRWPSPLLGIRPLAPEPFPG